MRTAPQRGSVLMETVVCLPLILMLLTGIVQFTRLWEARLFTRYAAYNAARAALVYNVADYGEVQADGGIRRVSFFSAKGPVWLAAVNTLAWKSHTSDKEGRSLPGIGNGFYPNSGEIRRQVRIDVEDSFEWLDATKSGESNGVVKVTVTFDFPLVFPIFDATVLQKEYGAGEEPDDVGGLVFAPVSTPDSLVHTFRLRESCILPKPWSTFSFPRLSGDELSHLNRQL